MSDFNEKQDVSLDSILDDSEGTPKSRESGVQSPKSDSDDFESPISRHDNESPFEDKSFEDHRLGQILDHPPGSVKIKHLESKMRSFLENIVQGEGKAHALEPMEFPSINVVGNISLGGSDLGTASLVDTGTAAGEVPLNSDIYFSADITVTVGSGGDYATINAALAALVKRKPLYDNSGITATINLLSGFVMAEQVLVYGLDLGWITIVGADTETVITHTALTTNFTASDYGYSTYPAFGVSRGGVLPRVGQLFRMSFGSATSDYKHGVMAIGAGSNVDILVDCGVKDAGTYSIFATRGSTINAHNVDASNAGGFGIYATNSAIINADGADASGGGWDDIRTRSGSTINADGAIASSFDPAEANTVTVDGIIFR